MAQNKLNVDLIYPIGSIYMSVNNTNPSTLFGGTWESWGAGRVPVGVDTAQAEFNSVEKTGGSNTVTLTIDQMPEHRHNFPYYGFQNLGGGGANGLAYNITNTGRIGYDYAGIGKTGNNQPHNNLQPYITCYMWKRIS